LVVIFLSEREREEKWIRNPNYEFANIFFSLGRNLLTRSGDNYLENILRFLNYDFFSCLSVCLLVCLFAQLWSLSFAFCSFGPNWEIEFPVHEQSWVDRERKKKDEKKERERKMKENKERKMEENKERISMTKNKRDQLYFSENSVWWSIKNQSNQLNSQHDTNIKPILKEN
jgi:hypothetical protein